MQTHPKMVPLAGRYDFIQSNDDYGQVNYLYNTVLSEDERANLISNLVYSLGQCRKDVQDNMLRLFYKVDEEYGRRVQEGLEANVKRAAEPEVGLLHKIGQAIGLTSEKSVSSS